MQASAIRGIRFAVPRQSRGRYTCVETMSRSAPKSQPIPCGLATTAGALVALVAISAMMSALPRATIHRAVPIESRAATTEAKTVRAVAAAVAAAARELAGAERIHAAIPTTLLSDARLLPPGEVGSLAIANPIVPSRMIGERLLDMPPPGC
jgi:hypothetical protein